MSYTSKEAGENESWFNDMPYARNRFATLLGYVGTDGVVHAEDSTHLPPPTVVLCRGGENLRKMRQSAHSNEQGAV